MLEARGLPADRIGADQEPCDQRDHGDDAGEAELLGDHRKQKVGMRLGQIKKLLDARTQAHPEPFAPAEGDQRMRQLITLAVRIRPGIEEAGEALQTVGRDPDQ